MMVLTVAQLDRLSGLARRAHDGEVVVEHAERDGLDYAQVMVLLTDMGDVPPLHTFLLSPRGVLLSA